MKRYIIKIALLVVTAVTMLTSCVDSASQDVAISSVRHGRKFVTSMSFAPMDNIPETKSQYTGSESLVTDWNLFVFDAAGTRCGAYYKADGDPIEFSVKVGEQYTYFALANVGNLTQSGSEAMRIKDVASFRAMTVNVTGYGSGLPMSWSGTRTFTREEYDNNSKALSLEVQMRRLVGKYNIVYDPSALKDWSYAVKSLDLYGVSTVRPFIEGSTGTSNATVNDRATNADITALNGGQAVKFFPVENVVPTPSSLSSNTDPWKKVPEQVGNLYPSYIEMDGEATMTDGSGQKKNVKFRFYLGKDNVKNFEVVRNEENTITFKPTDKSITEGHGGNWKVEPDIFTDYRSIRFNRNLIAETSAANPFRLRAGQSSDEAVMRLLDGAASNFKYKVAVQGGTPSDWLTVNNAGTSVSSMTDVDLSSLRINAKAGTDAEGWVLISTMDGQKSDRLYVQVYNAWLEVTPNHHLWDWDETGTAAAKSMTVKSSVPWSVTTPAGWTLSQTSGGATPATGTVVTVYPNSPQTSTDANTHATLTFSATDAEPKTVDLERRFKPEVIGEGDAHSIAFEWEAAQYGTGTKKDITFKANEPWRVVWDAAVSTEVQAHYTISATEGAATTGTTISVYPTVANSTVSVIPASFKIVPVRGSADVVEGAFAVSLNHKAASPWLNVSPAGNIWTWKQGAADAFTFNVTGNIAWAATLSDTDNWQINGSATGSGNGTVSVSPKNPNSLESARNATLTIVPTGGVTLGTNPTASLKQDGKPYVRVTNITGLEKKLTWAWTESSSAVAKEILLETSDDNWDITVSGVTGAVSHWTVTKDGANKKILVYPNAQNDDTENVKSINVLIKHNDADASVSVNVVCEQAKKVLAPYLNVSPAALRWEWNQHQEQSLTVSSNKDWTFSVSGADASHFTVTRSGDVLKVTTTDNGDEASGKSAVIGITCASNPELNTTVPLTQSKHPALAVSPDSYTWNYNESGTSAAKTLALSGDAAWTATLSNASDWTISAASGTAPGTVTVYPKAANGSTTADKTCTVTFTYAGRTRTVTLTQNRMTAFMVSPTSKTWIGTDVAPQTITVTASGSWRVTAPSGYTLRNSGNTVQTTVTGNGNGTFFVYPSAPNNTYSDYPAVQMAVTSGSETINVTLQQLAKVKEYTSYGLKIEAYDTDLDFKDRTTVSAVVYGVYDGTQTDVLEDVTNVVSWDYSQLGSVVTDFSGTYTKYMEVYNTSTTSKTGNVTAALPSSYRYEGNPLGNYTASEAFTVGGYPYISATDVTIDWNDTSNHSYSNVTTNLGSYSVSGFASWFTMGTSSSWRAAENTSTSSRSCTVTVTGTVQGVTVSDTFTITQGGKPAGPTYYDYTAAEIVVYLSEYTVDVGSSVRATAYFNVGTCRTTSPTAPTDKSDYTWTVHSEVTSSGFYTNAPTVALISGRNVTGIAAGNARIYSDYTFDETAYDAVFPQDFAGLTVRSASVTTYRYKVVTDVAESSIQVGGTTSASADLYRMTYVDGTATTGWEYQRSVTSSGFNAQAGGSFISISGSTVRGVSAGTATIRSKYSADEYEDADVTVNDVTVTGYEYRNLSVTLTASPTTIAASGGSSTLSASATWQYREVYSNGTYGSWTSGSTTTFSDFTVTGSASGFSRSGATVTASSNGSSSSRSVTYTASYSIGGLSDSDSATIEQDGAAPVVDHLEYRNLSVTLTASPTTIAASGGSSTLSASATWQYREVYSNGTYGSWTSGSTTTFSDFTVTGSASGFSRSGATVTASSNGSSSSRSVTYTASYSIGGLSDSDSATIEQDGAAATLVSLSIPDAYANSWAPANSVAYGDYISMTCIAHYSDGTTQDVTSSANWGTAVNAGSTNNVYTCNSNTVSASGVSRQITVSYGGKSTDFTLTLYPKYVVSMAVNFGDRYHQSDNAKPIGNITYNDGSTASLQAGQLDSYEVYESGASAPVRTYEPGDDVDMKDLGTGAFNIYIYYTSKRYGSDNTVDAGKSFLIQPY